MFNFKVQSATVSKSGFPLFIIDDESKDDCSSESDLVSCIQYMPNSKFEIVILFQHEAVTDKTQAQQH